MALIRPRLTELHGLSLAQAELDFAIPFVNEDIPLFVDPFLLWKSPSQQDQALHAVILQAFNHQNVLAAKGKREEAIQNLIRASECEEVGLGHSTTRRGKRISRAVAEQILGLFRAVPQYTIGFSHFEEIQLYIDGLSKDRVSDIACNFLKSFLIDYTIQQCDAVGIPTEKVVLDLLYDTKAQRFTENVEVRLPVNPEQGRPILLVPKRWLRHVPWISFDEYFRSYCPKDDVINKQGTDDRISVLTYNRDNYGAIEEYIRRKELTADDCRNDPLFTQLPVISAKRKLGEIKKLASGTAEKADKKYEDAATQLLASLMYPHMDFAATQSRTDSGVAIRDIVFYNNRSVEFLADILDAYQSRQIVMELKNVKAIERDHINQLNRYLGGEFGNFGVLVTRNPLPRAMFKNTVDLWSGRRRCIIAVTDADLEQMVEVFESKQRLPIEVLKKKYVEFIRACPT